MSRGSACASRRDRAFVLPEEPQQRRLAEWRNRGTSRPTGWEDKRARRLAEFAARMPAIMAQMTSGVSEAIAEALQATRAEHLKELDLAPTPTTTSVISESSTSIQMSGGSSSISTAGGGASASHDFVLPSAVPITCSTDCPQRDSGSTDATAATSASATGAVSTMCVLHEGGVHLAMSCFQPRDKLTFVLPSTATPATSSVPQTIAQTEYVVAPANSSANIMVGPEARIPTTTTPAASAALELDSVIALPANRVCLDNVPAMPATVLLQDALIITDSGSSDVLVSMSASLDKLEAADTAVTHEEEQQLTCLSVERTLASVSAKDVANDGNLVTGTSVMTLTVAILGVHVDSIADKHEAIASSAVPPIKLIHGDSNSGDTVSMLPWDPGDSTIRLWTMKIMFQYVTRYEFLAVPWDSGQQVTNGHKCHTGLDFTMVLYAQDVTDTCLEQLQSQRTNYSWSTYLQFGKLQDAMGALLDMKSWPFWLFALEYFDGGNMFRQPSRGLYLELYLLVLVVMRKEAALWTIFQSASRDTILLLHWDPGALMYEMCTKFQVELEQKWMVSSIASSLAMLYTIHYHFPSGNLMLLDTAAANSNIITYLHSKGPPAGDESACVASKHLLVPNASTSPGFSFTRIGVLVTLSPGLGVGQGSNMLFAVCPVHWKIVWSIVLECSASGNKYGQPFVTTILNCEDYFEKRSTVLPPFSPKTVQADWSHSLQVDWSQLYHVGNYDCHYLTSNKASTGAFHSSAHVSVSGSCSMNLGQGQLSWDPGIRALLTFYDGDCEQVHGVDQVHIGHVLCSYELFTQAAAQVGIKVDATTYCYSHFISSFLDQALLSHDYYIDIVQVHLGHFYSISHHNHLGAGKIKESHVPWDPGGLTWHGLGGKPKFMEEGLSATLLYQSWAGQWAAVCWAWAYSEASRRSTTNRRGTTMEGLGSERTERLRPGLAWRVWRVHLLPPSARGRKRRRSPPPDALPRLPWLRAAR